MPGGTAVPTEPQLRRLLRYGTFAQVLDHALNSRGLSLDAVQRRLAERGVRVSRAALSYWRHGRSRPERTESLRAVGELEGLLGLPAGALVSRLGPPRPRGRGYHPVEQVADRRRLWPAHCRFLAELKAPPDDQVRYLDIHERVRVDAEQRLASVRTTLVLEAVADRVDRCIVYHWNDENLLPTVTGTRYCRLGRIRGDRAAGSAVGELLLDQRLVAGERTVVEYSWRFPPGNPLDFYHRRFTRSPGIYVLQVEFTGRPPAYCVPYRHATMDAPRRIGPRLWIGESNTAHLILTDPEPGIAGLQWEWD